VGIATLEPSSWDGNIAFILAHGAGQGMESPFMTYFHRGLATAGFLSVQFNFDYIEQGRKVPDPQPKLQSRYRTVIGEIISQYKPNSIIIGGKSMGGRVASYIAGDAPGVSGLVFLGYPLHPPGKLNALRDQHLYSLNLPMLFVSGTNDTFAGRDLLQDVVNKIGPRATLMWIDGGDHSLKQRRKNGNSLPAVLDRIAEWSHQLSGS